MISFRAFGSFLGSVLAHAWIPESTNHSNPSTFTWVISTTVLLIGLVALLAVWCTTFIYSSARLPQDIERGEQAVSQPLVDKLRPILEQHWAQAPGNRPSTYSTVCEGLERHSSRQNSLDSSWHHFLTKCKCVAWNRNLCILYLLPHTLYRISTYTIQHHNNATNPMYPRSYFLNQT